MENEQLSEDQQKKKLDKAIDKAEKLSKQVSGNSNANDPVKKEEEAK